MDISLLRPSFIVILGFILGAALATLISIELQNYILARRSKKKLPRRFNWKWYLAAAVISVVLALLAQFITSPRLPGELPGNFWLMVLPFSFSLCLSIVFWVLAGKWIKVGGVVVMLLGLLFSLAVINAHYAFFPTLYSIFSPDTRKILEQQNQDVTRIQFSAQTGDKRTVEASLFGADYSDRGQIASFVAPGKVSGFIPRTEWAYIPAIANNNKKIRLPVIVLLPGSPGLTYAWLNYGLKSTLNTFASYHHGITPYVFIADDTGSISNDTECVNSPRGNVETYLTVDFPNYIKQHYKVDLGSSNWAISGLSMGGTCSVMLALRHPNVYSVFMDFSGEIGPEVGSKHTTIDQLFGGSSEAWQNHQPLYLLSHTPKKTLEGMYGFYGVGSSDARIYQDSAKELYRKSRQVGLPSRFESVGGTHAWQVWEALFRDSLPWTSNRLGATDCLEVCTGA